MARNCTSATWSISQIFHGQYHQGKDYSLTNRSFNLIDLKSNRIFAFSFSLRVQSSAKSVGCATCTSNSLVLYKLANLILTLPQHEELLPIFCQKFFHLYLTRIRFTADEERFTDVYGVADKFYDANIPLMKKLKKFFVDGAKFEKERSIKSDEQNLSDFFSARSR